jgi:uncharacterized protein (TIGR02452 family)
MRVRPSEDADAPKRKSRKENKEIAEQTLEILKTGIYTTEESDRVDFVNELTEAIVNTVTYPPSKTPLSFVSDEELLTCYSVVKSTTLSACTGHGDAHVCALNFASAKNPGGGFLKGSTAQEESLARASALYSCIEESVMYDINRENNNRCLYSDYMIYSPNVPVFRDDNDNLLESPYLVSFITAPAVNAKQAKKRNVSDDEIQEVTESRIDRLLSVAAGNQVNVLILGAWGCGVFGGDIKTVGNLFFKALTKKYRGVFDKVIFAVLSDYDYNTLNGLMKHYT